MANFSDDILLDWADFLRDYAENWDDHFKQYGDDFFTQEFWYLLVGIVEAYWRKDPMNLATAKSEIRGLKKADDKTKNTRIKAAEDAGLIKRRSFAELSDEIRQNMGAGDNRKTYLIPTPRLEKELRAHLSETLSEAMQKLPQK
ncbi:hypothetical protein AB7M16_002017 [Bradyrhizobium sp. USDA 372]